MSDLLEKVNLILASKQKPAATQEELDDNANEDGLTVDLIAIRILNSRIIDGVILQGRSRRGKTTNYGQKGGSGATAGKKMTTYLVKFPDGTTTKKRSAFVNTETAYAMIYQHENVWYVSSIVDTPQNWGSQQAIQVSRFK